MHRLLRVVVLVGVMLTARGAGAQEAASEPIFEPSRLSMHGFVSEGAFVTTANDYIGHSSRGSVELFQAALNVTDDVTDRVRVGLQLFSHREGLYGDYTPRLDWAYVDYRPRPWLSLRAGHIKIPFGLYNEYVDVDAGRLQILLPQSVYPIGNRDVLLAHTGASIGATLPLFAAGELDLQLYGGTLFVPIGDGGDGGTRITEADTKYLIGGQVFYRPPVEGLRVGGSVLRASIDFHARFDQASVDLLKAIMLVPPDFDGRFTTSFRPVTLKVASAEYVHDNWLFAAEYARWYARTRSSLPDLFPTGEVHSERFYVMASYRVSERIETGAYYSVFFPDVYDRGGKDAMLKKPFYAWQRDAAATIRFDAADSWTWKLEGHFIDGVATLFDGAVLDPSLNQSPTRYWGLLLLDTTVTF
jgi:hypothetical protein